MTEKTIYRAADGTDVQTFPEIPSPQSLEKQAEEKAGPDPVRVRRTLEHIIFRLRKEYPKHRRELFFRVVRSDGDVGVHEADVEELRKALAPEWVLEEESLSGRRRPRKGVLLRPAKGVIDPPGSTQGEGLTTPPAGKRRGRPSGSGGDA